METLSPTTLFPFKYSPNHSHGVTYSLNTIETLLTVDQQISFYCCSTVNHLIDQLQTLVDQLQTLVDQLQT